MPRRDFSINFRAGQDVDIAISFVLQGQRAPAFGNEKAVVCATTACENHPQRTQIVQTGRQRQCLRLPIPFALGRAARFANPAEMCQKSAASAESADASRRSL